MNFRTSCFFLTFFFLQNALAKINHEFIPSTKTNEKIEIYWSKPSTDNVKHPFLLMVHPHQSWPNKIGAEVFVKNDLLVKWTAKGFVVAAVSQPGYGKLEGSPDFCGEKSQQVVIDALNHFKNLDFIDNHKMFLYGGSRGAVVSSIVATQYSDLAGVILKSGVYDLVKASESYSWFNPIKLTMLWEIGSLVEEQLKSRSAFYFADRIKTPLLMIHGTKDDRADIESAKLFANKVNSSGGNAELISVESEHIIPMPMIEPYMDVFFKKVMK